MTTLTRFDAWWNDPPDNGPEPLGPLSKETARWIWDAALAQPAAPATAVPSGFVLVPVNPTWRPPTEP